MAETTQPACQLILGDCREVLKGIPDNSIDSVVTDPPCAVHFMGKEWDNFKKSKTEGEEEGEASEGANFINWLTVIMRECLRTLKPGGHALVWALPRTSHWTATAIENAGFEVREIINHLFGTGFPKSLDISKAIDKTAGIEREVIGPSSTHSRGKATSFPSETSVEESGRVTSQANPVITAPATEDAKKWSGFGTALKPCSENWILARKPIEGTVANNVLKHGTGGLNIDGCRVSGPVPSTSGQGFRTVKFGGQIGEGETTLSGVPWTNNSGRFPGNLILSHSPLCQKVGTTQIKGGNDPRRKDGTVNHGGQVYGGGLNGVIEKTDHSGYSNENGEETVDLYACVPGCPIRTLDDQSGVLTSGTGAIRRTMSKADVYDDHARDIGRHMIEYGDSGGASRYFYCAKASSDDRSFYCRVCQKAYPKSARAHHEHDRKNSEHIVFHPTVKPTELMRWLIRLVTPPDGLVVDPFMGTGSTGVAALKERMRFLGIEQDPEYLEIAKQRIQDDNPLFNRLQPSL